MVEPDDLPCEARSSESELFPCVLLLKERVVVSFGRSVTRRVSGSFCRPEIEHFVQMFEAPAQRN